ncbi:Uncharacterized protein DBV15_04491 [Temnothorax longispinosus]|uniref:Uncharacterized protein n=1 Tax=Temnothorax longispinosus TaxID=300112 RepID=A0A4S2KAQ2_9HYME|nr:Uncharacterized protein DBV15_04491 [Temnothorax longispinosus]
MTTIKNGKPKHMAQIHRSPRSGIALVVFGKIKTALRVAWEGPGKLRAAIKRGKAGMGKGRELETEGNDQERLVVGRSVEARSREPADEPSLKL